MKIFNKKICAEFFLTLIFDSILLPKNFPTSLGILSIFDIELMNIIDFDINMYFMIFQKHNFEFLKVK